MPDPVVKENASAEQSVSYFEALVETKLGVSSAQATLNARRSATNDADETRYIDIQAHELRSEYSKLQATEIAFLSNTFRFRPPAPDTVAEIKSIVRRLDALEGGVARAVDVVEAVTGLLNTWRTTLA